MRVTNTKIIGKEISDNQTLSLVIKAYQEISSFRMRKTRNNVLESRDFMEALNRVFEDVRTSFSEEVSKLIKKKKIKKGERITFLSHNGRTVNVFLGSNTGLYGDIVKKTFLLFLKDVRESGNEVTIIGRRAMNMFLAEEPTRPYTYFDLPDRETAQKDLVNIIKHIVQYQDINVYFGRFDSVLRQTPVKLNVSAQVPAAGEGERERRKYIYEPTLEEVLKFFEKEMFVSLFDQVVRESQLAKHASRIVAMDEASENLKKKLVSLQLEHRRMEHRKSNKKQLNYLSSVFAWSR